MRPVHGAFLAPLIVDTQVGRTVTVVCEPVATSRAIRRTEGEVQHERATVDVRERFGFAGGERAIRRQADAEVREGELVDGHGLYRFAGYVTVSAANEEDLESASREVTGAAHRAHLELRVLVGEQARALSYAIPGLCRGLD